jgi:probable phosphomutase (TIGR03848 family)
MTTFLLIRHGNNDMLDRRILIGRTPGISLNAEGRGQAVDLAGHLASLPIQALYSSPMERTRETAQPLAERLDQPVHILEEVNEVDFGTWTGRGFDQLANDPQWKAYRAFRSGSRIPGGEMIIQVQQRMIVAMETLCNRHGQGMVAIFSHGDPIRTAIAYFLGMPLDFLLRLRINTASVSVVEYNSSRCDVLCINHVPAGAGFQMNAYR